MNAALTKLKWIVRGGRPAERQASLNRRGQDASHRRERVALAKTVREGKRTAKETLQRGSKECRAKYKDCTTTENDCTETYAACRSAVAADHVAALDRLGPAVERIAVLDKLLPARDRTYRSPAARLNQARWDEQIEEGSRGVLDAHPELGALIASELQRYRAPGSKASRALREGWPGAAATVAGRVYDLLLRKAHDAGWTPEDGLAGAGDLQLDADDMAAASVRRLVEQGPWFAAPTPTTGAISILKGLVRTHGNAAQFETYEEARG